MRIDGTEVADLGGDLQPTDCGPYYISPDGHWITYQQADDGLWAVPTDGGTALMLSEAMAGSVSWFPDSSGVVYTLNNDVYAQWLDLSRPRQPLAVGGRRYLFPTWSPDGKYISFLETTDDPNVFNVILIQSDGTGWRTLGATAPESNTRHLCPDVIAWSPDSTRFLVVGAFIYWSDGEFKKDMYRRVRIKRVQGIDDYSMMEEIIERMIHNSGVNLPHLLVIDGGKGHLETAKKIIDREFGSTKKSPEMVAVAKGPDRAYLTNSDEAVGLEDRSQSSLLLKSIRDEAHRFAIGYHRKLRGKNLLRSPLEKISGIGRKRRLELLRVFGSIESIRNATH